MTDSQVIAYLIDEKLNEGQPLGQAIKSVCETRLYGTWRLAILGSEKLYLATNSGDFFLGKNEDTVIFSSEASIAEEISNFKF